MFRRRNSSRQPVNTTPSASAQSAATRAFIASRDASPSLSSAAAAAALRSHTPPPTSPANVQTKRMLQRQLSNSSRGSASGGGLRHGPQSSLRRTPSSGSMTSRTFRESSPGRPQSSLDTPSYQAPPVPPLPSQLSNHNVRRSVSAQPSRGAASSTRRGNARVASLDRPSIDLNASPVSPRSSFSKGNSLESERPGSRTSVNFSYPMSARPNSPPQSPVQHEIRQNSDGQSPSPPLSTEEIADIQHSINKTANSRVKTKPQTAAPGSKEGSHFAQKTMGSRPTGTALQDKQESLQLERTHLAEAASAEDASILKNQSQSALAYQDDSTGGLDNEAAQPHPKKRPSMVMEDHEAEELAEAADIAQGEAGQNHPTLELTNIKQVQPSREVLYIDPAKTSQPNPNYHTRQSPSTSSAPSSPRDKLTVDYSNPDHQVLERQPSVSPNRSARFSAQLTIAPNSPLHEPPSRSISPGKSALKSSSSPDRRNQTGRAPSEFSDGTSIASDEGSRTGFKKKMAKVSFDDEAEVMGVSASPPTSPEPTIRSQSPVEKQKSKKWYAISMKKSSTKDAPGGDDFESVMRPRPALPSFGSIRGMREPEEAVLTSLRDDDSDLSSDDELESEKLGISSDHAIAGILVNAHQHDSGAASKQTFSTLTKKFSLSEAAGPEMACGDETVPEVTGGSRMLDGAAVQPHLPTVEEEQVPPTGDSNKSIPVRVPDIDPGKSAEPPQGDRLKEPVPIIAIQPATPGEENRQSIDLRDMPGGFPSYSAESAPPSKSQQNSALSNEFPIQTSNDEPLPTETAESDDGSGESIYSDAAEDPTEFEGDMFGSINAIVDSPVPTQSLLPRQVPDSPTRVVHPGPLAKVAEPVSPPSLEALNPTAPTTSSDSSKSPIVTSSSPPSSLTQQRSSGPADSSWPLKPALKTSMRASNPAAAQAMSPSQHEGSHLRVALGKPEMQQQQQRHSLNNSSKLASSAAARPKSALITSQVLPKDDVFVSSAVTKPKRASTTSQVQSRNSMPAKRQSEIKNIAQPNSYPAAFSKIKSDDSDSDSSFKRNRRSSRSGSGRQISMKRTMRASTSNSETWSDRSTSPRASMRTTLRGSNTERSSAFGSLRDRSMRTRPQSVLVTSNIRSRFGDDGGDGERAGSGRHLFKSRFADSSDEDEPTPSSLTPVRGIPRRQGRYDGESTDLDDSSDEENKRNIRNGGGKASQQLTPEEINRILSQPKKKGGLLSRLRSPTRGSGKEGKVSKLKMESPARRDTHLERSRLELERARDGTYASEASRPISPKLQKKYRYAHNEPWPLSATTAPRGVLDDTRPSTSDGVVNVVHGMNLTDSFGDRPLNKRHGTSDSIDSKITTGTSAATEVVTGHTGKKKRFPMLRKAFGLRD